MSVRKLIGVILSDVTAEYSRRILRGIIRQANEYDYNVAIFSTFIKTEGTTRHKIGEKNIFQLPNYQMFDGIIVVPDTIRLEGLASEVVGDIIKKCKCPVVCGDMFFSPIHHIQTDEGFDFKHMVEHFIREHKFTRINCLTGPRGVMQSELRLSGYKSALLENGLPFEEERVWYGDFWRQSGKDMVEALLKGNTPLPEAIVCANDYMAITVCEALKEKGIRVPEDICVSGYDNVREANLNTPSITTIMPPLEGIGRRCVSYIHEVIEEIEKDESTLYGSIVFAESCGCKFDNPYDKNILMKEKNYQYVLDNMKDDFTVMNLMGENLIGVSTLEELLKGLCEHTYLLKDYNDFYLCLCNNWDSIGEDEEEGNYLVSGYTETMRLELIFENKEYANKQDEFPVSIMLPDLYKEHDSNKIYYFVPVHFKDRCFGYGVFSFGNQVKILDYTYRSWVRNINNSLEFVRVQNNLRWCYDRLDEIAIRDALTGVYNRRGLERYMYNIYNQCILDKTPFIMMVGDLDDLKIINDEYGHIEGDRAIQVVTKAFKSIKSQDTILARTGGDEFVLIMNGNYSIEEVYQIKQDIHTYLDNVNTLATYPYKIGVSIGLYYGIPKEKGSFNECHSIADRNMYIEKSKRKQLSSTHCMKTL